MTTAINFVIALIEKRPFDARNILMNNGTRQVRAAFTAVQAYVKTLLNEAGPAAYARIEARKSTPLLEPIK
jgi:hypothetical protein